MNGRSVHFRTAKITPTKVGQFVTLWKRSSDGVIYPYSSTDNFDLVVISVKSHDRLGQFIFPKAVLLERKILSSACNKGKLGFRVYPIWDCPFSRQAQQTQQWQQAYFLEIPLKESVDTVQARLLCEVKS